MSLRRNILANYVGQAYLTSANILIVPIYLRYMGAEAYGLIGFFALIQTWFQLLDLGVSHTLSREVARYRGGATTAGELRRLMQTLEVIFAVVGLVGALGVAMLAQTIAHRWLRVEHLPLPLVTWALRVTGATVAVRWVSGIYRSVLTGFEEQVWLNGLNILAGTARTFLTMALFSLVGTDVLAFATYQFMVSVVELVALVTRTRRALPTSTERSPWSFEPLRGVLKFSLSVAFAGAVWVTVGQSDKLVLSKVLSLKEFGTFTLGVLGASAISVVSGPVSQALLPRLARLAAEGDESKFLELYRSSTQWVCVLIAPISAVLVVYAEPLLLAWTSRTEQAHAAAPVLRLYSLGNGFIAIAAFQYYLQYARGNLRLHVAGNIGFVIALLPLLVWSAKRFGALGAGAVWVAQSVLYLLVWTWVVHRRFAPELRWRWLFFDVAPTFGGVWAAAAALHAAGIDVGTSRPRIIATVAALAVLLLLVALLSTRDARMAVRRRLMAS
ncbi:MAG: oligosaccharide flippase family protein [Labilithrix sp.]